MNHIRIIFEVIKSPVMYVMDGETKRELQNW